jgi:hypothetical protein
MIISILQNKKKRWCLDIPWDLDFNQFHETNPTKQQNWVHTYSLVVKKKHPNNLRPSPSPSSPIPPAPRIFWVLFLGEVHRWHVFFLFKDIVLDKDYDCTHTQIYIYMYRQIIYIYMYIDKYIDTHTEIDR